MEATKQIFIGSKGEVNNDSFSVTDTPYNRADVCPFCKWAGFDLPELKHHLTVMGCEGLEETPDMGA